MDFSKYIDDGLSNTCENPIGDPDEYVSSYDSIRKRMNDRRELLASENANMGKWNLSLSPMLRQRIRELKTFDVEMFEYISNLERLVENAHRQCRAVESKPVVNYSTVNAKIATMQLEIDEMRRAIERDYEINRQKIKVLLRETDAAKEILSRIPMTDAVDKYPTDDAADEDHDECSTDCLTDFPIDTVMTAISADLSEKSSDFGGESNTDCKFPPLEFKKAVELATLRLKTNITSFDLLN